jgi:hypothetical protein
MKELDEMNDTNVFPMTQPESEATLGDLVFQARRIADALEAAGSPACGEVKGEVRCALLPTHVGHHVSADGRMSWLDE